MTYPGETPALAGSTATEPPPRVQYAWYQAGRGRRVPLWAFSIPELNEAERERAELLGLLWPPEAEIHARLRARFSRLREDLRDQTKAKESATPQNEAAKNNPADISPVPLDAHGAQAVVIEKPAPVGARPLSPLLGTLERPHLKA